MKNFTVACINPSKNELWQIHKADCRDLGNGRTRNIEYMTQVKAESPEAAEDKWLDSEMREIGYKPGDGSVKIMPCCKDAPTAPAQKLITMRDGTKTEVDGGIQRLAEAIGRALVEVPIQKAITTYELAEILVFNHHHNRGDIQFIDAVVTELSAAPSAASQGR